MPQVVRGHTYDVNVPHDSTKKGCNRVPCCLAKAAQLDAYF